jgi:hypothetical protein
MSFIRFMDRLGKYSFHAFYFNIIAIEGTWGNT